MDELLRATVGLTNSANVQVINSIALRDLSKLIQLQKKMVDVVFKLFEFITVFYV